ncbi:MAG: hypothetical protein ACRC4U_07420 [Shewanella sp.]
MVWPASDVNNTNTASGSAASQPAAARLDFRDLITKFNLLRNHVPAFMQGLLTSVDAPTARLTLGVPPFPRDYRQGLVLSTLGASASFSVEAGQIADRTNIKVITLLTNRAKTTGAFVQGDALGGLTSGAIANNTTYYPYAIERPDTGFVDVCYDTNPTTPNLSAANLVPFTIFERLPWVISTNGSAQWLPPVSLQPTPGAVRQTVLSGPVDANGIPNFGGSLGGTVVTATGTLVISASNGYGEGSERIGVISNPSWPALNASGDGVKYLYLDVNADATCSTVSGTLLTAYTRGGPYNNALGQNIFNITDMQMRVGNGSSNTQVWRVPVGEVSVVGGFVASIRWYALQGEYKPAFISPLIGVNSQASLLCNMGNDEFSAEVELVCTAPDLVYVIGDRLTKLSTTNATFAVPLSVSQVRNVVTFSTSTSTAFAATPKGGGAISALNPNAWGYRITCKRNF